MVFHNTNHQLNILAYTKLLAAHVNYARHEKALVLFQRMHGNPTLTLDQFVYPLALKSCSAIYRPLLGTSIHAETVKTSFFTSPFVLCALVDMYGKCVSINIARKLFDEIPQRNVVVWNAMISLYCGTKDVSSALQLFQLIDVEPNASSFNPIMAALSEMDDGGNRTIGFYRRMVESGIKPNLITLLALLPTCVGVAALNMVKEIHGYSVRDELDLHLQLSSGLVEAYGRCGGLRYARLVFECMPERDLVAYSSMVSAYALHGEAQNAFKIFQEMEFARIRPDGIAFLGIIKACCHARLSDEAFKYFEQMQKEYGIKGSSEHYACLVDALGRAGRVYEAYKLIREMPVKATVKAWGALLTACRSYGEVELAKIAGEALVEMEPDSAANYVLLASVYAGAGRFDEANSVRAKMKEKGLKTFPGGSWIIDNV